VAAGPQIVAVVFEKFFKTGAGHVNELEFGSLEVPLAWLAARTHRAVETMRAF